MKEQSNFALVPRPTSAVEKAEPGTKRILSSMVTDALVPARAAEEDRNLERARRSAVATEELAMLIRKAANEGVVEVGLRKRLVIARLLNSSVGYVPATDDLRMKGYQHYWGTGGLAVDYHEAVKYYRLAAELGSEMAQIGPGYCYCDGKGVPQDYSAATKWFRKAAEQGFDKGQTNLGCCYANGHGVPQDHAEAVKWFRKAAEQGDAHAQNLLGDCYAEGEGVPQDFEQAFRWYRIAAEFDNPTAQFNLAVCYLRRGAGVTKDTLQAYKWLKLAAKEDKQGDSKATKRLAALSASMSANELADGDRAYEEYTKRKWS